jgi:hypothetical protein
VWPLLPGVHLIETMGTPIRVARRECDLRVSGPERVAISVIGFGARSETIAGRRQMAAGDLLLVDQTSPSDFSGFGCGAVLPVEHDDLGPAGQFFVDAVAQQGEEHELRRQLTLVMLVAGPDLAGVPAAIRESLRGRLAPAEVFHEILEHRWYMSERVGRDVGTTAAARSWVSWQCA